MDAPSKSNAIATRPQASVGREESAEVALRPNRFDASMAISALFMAGHVLISGLAIWPAWLVAGCAAMMVALLYRRNRLRSVRASSAGLRLRKRLGSRVALLPWEQVRRIDVAPNGILLVPRSRGHVGIEVSGAEGSRGHDELARIVFREAHARGIEIRETRDGRAHWHRRVGLLPPVPVARALPGGRSDGGVDE